MISDLFLIFLAAAALVAWFDWRRGILLAVVAGCLQDPVRKLTPGTPAWFAIASLPVWLALGFGAWHSDRRLGARLGRAYPQFLRLLRWFLLCLLPPTLVVFSYGLGAWRLALLGVFAYLAPIGALLLGFNFARDAGDIRRLFAAYAVFTALLLSGAVLEYSGLMPDWPALGTRALGAVWLRYSRSTGATLRLISGFYRSPDIMGWHAAMLVMVSLTLLLVGRRGGMPVWLAAAVWGGVCVLVSGRRKAIVMPIVWLVVIAAGALRGRRAGPPLAILLACAAVAAGLFYASGELAVHNDYYDYAVTMAADAPGRLAQGTFGAVLVTIVQSGVLGRGIGSATQGGQHLAGGIEQGWQESGLSKLMAELGLPGFACALALAFSVARGAYRALRTSARTQTGLPTALAGIVVANGASFIVSHQVYGDMTTMAFTSLCVGLLLSAPRWSLAPPPPPVAPLSPVARGPRRTPAEAS